MSWVEGGGRFWQQSLQNSIITVWKQMNSVHWKTSQQLPWSAQCHRWWWREYGKVERYRIEEKGGKCFWVTNRVGPTATNNASRANQHWVASQSLTAKSHSNVSSVKVDIETVGKFIIWQKRLILAISIIVTPSSSLAPSSSQPERQERVWREILQSGLSNLGSLNTHNALHRGGTNFG